MNLILDEFNNIGSIPDFSRRLSTIRSRNIRVSFAVQNLAQLQNRYPNNLWAEILGNCDTQILLGCTDELTAEFVSARTGDMTVEVNSTMTVRKTIAVAQVIPQYRYSESLGKRRLMTPDEVLRLPGEELLIMLRGQKVLKAKKFDYTLHPASKKLIRSSISDYVPMFHMESVLSTPMKAAESTEPVKPADEKPSLYETEIPPTNF